MSAQADFLVEIGTEELPPKALWSLASALAAGVAKGFDGLGLTYRQAIPYAAPRRLAVLVTDLATQQAAKNAERRGPAITAAFDDSGMPTPATVGFAKSCGVAVDQLERSETSKGAWLVFRSVQSGRSAAELIPTVVQTALDALPIPKRMRWGSTDHPFVRPVHWTVLLLGDQVVAAQILGTRAGRETPGHRFMCPRTLHLAKPSAYLPLLETEGRVLVDFAARREAISAQVSEAAVAAGGVALIDAALLDEVTALVEWPVALRGQFDARFLSIPQAALVSTLQSHQKYFPVLDPKTQRLLPCFVTVANIESPTPEVIRAGNERVVRARLEDAMFFFQRDNATPLSQRLNELGAVVYQKQLGTVLDKVQRVKSLALSVARDMGADAATCHRVARAAELCKCDLLTAMVNEFPDLQGVMGREYAARQGEGDEVAWAIDEHYMPRFAGDALPRTVVGQALGVADRVDTLCGIFSVGLVPTGDKDPFGLRRAALGLLRILIEQRRDVDLRKMIDEALALFGRVELAPGATRVSDVGSEVFTFVSERLRAYYLDQGILADEFAAVAARQPTQPYDFDRRLKALVAFRKLPQAASLSAANKRISNILRQAPASVASMVDVSQLHDAAEKQLYDVVSRLAKDVEPLWQRREYEPALLRLAQLREPIDVFFDKVMVMIDDVPLRDNRLALVKQVNDLFLRVADLSKLQS